MVAPVDVGRGEVVLAQQRGLGAGAVQAPQLGERLLEHLAGFVGAVELAKRSPAICDQAPRARVVRSELATGKLLRVREHLEGFVATFQRHQVHREPLEHLEAFLTLAHSNQFVEGITSGRGFIALAVVVFARWSPLGAFVVSLLFGLFYALQLQLQAQPALNVPYQALQMLPYVMTIVALVMVRKGVTPTMLGVPYNKA